MSIPSNNISGEGILTTLALDTDTVPELLTNLLSATETTVLLCLLLLLLPTRGTRLRSVLGAPAQTSGFRPGILARTSTDPAALSPLIHPARGVSNQTASHSPGLLGFVRVLKRNAEKVGGGQLDRMFRRPRFLRGPYTNTPLHADRVRTQRLTLRPHTLEDADRWYELQSNPSVVRYLPWEIRSKNESLAHLRTRTKLTTVWQSDDLLALAIDLNGLMIGDVSLQLRSVSAEVRMVELGWILDPEHGGHGYATEAALRMAQLAFHQLDAKLITAVIQPGNTKSVALAERIGFHETDRNSAHVLFSLSAGDFLDALARRPALRQLLYVDAP